MLITRVLIFQNSGDNPQKISSVFVTITHTTAQKYLSGSSFT